MAQIKKDTSLRKAILQAAITGQLISDIGGESLPLADAVVNAANSRLWEGSGICGVIFSKCGSTELAQECLKYQTPIKDGNAVITSACKMKNAKYIIHAVGPDFRQTPKAFLELHNAYYNSLILLKDNNLHSISFPLISSGIFAGNLPNPAEESAKQCSRAYKKFI